MNLGKKIDLPFDKKENKKIYIDNGMKELNLWPFCKNNNLLFFYDPKQGALEDVEVQMYVRNKEKLIKCKKKTLQLPNERMTKSSKKMAETIRIVYKLKGKYKNYEDFAILDNEDAAHLYTELGDYKQYSIEEITSEGYRNLYVIFDTTKLFPDTVVRLTVHLPEFIGAVIGVDCCVKKGLIEKYNITDIRVYAR